MTNEFGQRVYPVIRHVLNVLSEIRQEDSSPDPQLVATELRTLLAQFDVQGGRRKEYLLARSALVYWIDEVLVNSDWEYAGYWSNNTLERSYFDSRERAFQFFQKAEAARSLENLDTLETFFLCACFGFEGVYRDGEVAVHGDSKSLSAEDTWDPDQEPPGESSREPEADASGQAADTTPKKKDKGGSDWWDSDEADDQGMMTWGLGADEMSESLIGDASEVRAPLPTRTKNQAATFQEWIDSVYQQLAPTVQPPYVPENSPTDLGQAGPLTGRPALVTAATLLIAGFGLCVILLIVSFSLQA